MDNISYIISQEQYSEQYWHPEILFIFISSCFSCFCKRYNVNNVCSDCCQEYYIKPSYSLVINKNVSSKTIFYVLCNHNLQKGFRSFIKTHPFNYMNNTFCYVNKYNIQRYPIWVLKFINYFSVIL